MSQIEASALCGFFYTLSVCFPFLGRLKNSHLVSTSFFHILHGMSIFPLFNVIFLIILYRIHRPIFYITTLLEVLLYVIGVWYVQDTFVRPGNQFLYYLTITGIGLIIGVAAFFIAITLNHRHLYTEDHE